jgi:hypothetical protein
METTKITRCNIGNQVGFAWYANDKNYYVRLMGGITVKRLTSSIKLFEETSKQVNTALVNTWLKQLTLN